MKHVLFLFLFGISLNSKAIVGGEVVNETDSIAFSTLMLSNGCSGTLISRDWVLTAAHCLGGLGEISVSFTIDSEDIYQADQIIPHPLFFGTANGGLSPENPATSPVFDIGLLHLERPTDEKFRIVSIIKEQDLPASSEEVILAGFGVTNPQTNLGGGVLRKVTTLINFYNSNAGEIVFGPTPGFSACRGDSGGPMYLDKNGELFLMGATSRGFSSLGPCSGNGNYSSASFFRAWIEEHTGAL